MDWASAFAPELVITSAVSVFSLLAVALPLLFVSMHLSNESLRLGALALALPSTIFALIGLALLESLKIGVYSRLLRCIEEALGYEAPAARDAMPGELSPAPVGLGER
jgi:hypothetical protein